MANLINEYNRKSDPSNVGRVEVPNINVRTGQASTELQNTLRGLPDALPQQQPSTTDQLGQIIQEEIQNGSQGLAAPGLPTPSEMPVGPDARAILEQQRTQMRNEWDWRRTQFMSAPAPQLYESQFADPWNKLTPRPFESFADLVRTADDVSFGLSPFRGDPFRNAFEQEPGMLANRGPGQRPGEGRGPVSDALPDNILGDMLRAFGGLGGTVLNVVEGLQRPASFDGRDLNVLGVNINPLSWAGGIANTITGAITGETNQQVQQRVDQFNMTESWLAPARQLSQEQMAVEPGQNTYAPLRGQFGDYGNNLTGLTMLGLDYGGNVLRGTALTGFRAARTIEHALRGESYEYNPFTNSEANALDDAILGRRIFSFGEERDRSDLSLQRLVPEDAPMWQRLGLAAAGFILDVPEPSDFIRRGALRAAADGPVRSFAQPALPPSSSRGLQLEPGPNRPRLGPSGDTPRIQGQDVPRLDPAALVGDTLDDPTPYTTVFSIDGRTSVEIPLERTPLPPANRLDGPTIDVEPVVTDITPPRPRPGQVDVTEVPDPSIEGGRPDMPRLEQENASALMSPTDVELVKRLREDIETGGRVRAETARVLADPEATARVINQAVEDGALYTVPSTGALVRTSDLRAYTEKQLARNLLESSDAATPPARLAELEVEAQQLQELFAKVEEVPSVVPKVTAADIDVVVPVVEQVTIRPPKNPAQLFQWTRNLPENARIYFKDAEYVERTPKQLTALARFLGHYTGPRKRPLNADQLLTLRQTYGSVYSTYGPDVDMKALDHYAKTGVVRVETEAPDPVLGTPQQTRLTTKLEVRVDPSVKKVDPLDDIEALSTDEIRTLLDGEYSRSNIWRSGQKDVRRSRARADLMDELNRRDGLEPDWDEVADEEVQALMDEDSFDLADMDEEAFERYAEQAALRAEARSNVDAKVVNETVPDNQKVASPEGEQALKEVVLAEEDIRVQGENLRELVGVVEELERGLDEVVRELNTLPNVADQPLNVGTHDRLRQQAIDEVADSSQRRSARRRSPESVVEPSRPVQAPTSDPEERLKRTAVGSIKRLTQEEYGAATILDIRQSPPFDTMSREAQDQLLFQLESEGRISISNLVNSSDLTPGELAQTLQRSATSPELGESIQDFRGFFVEVEEDVVDAGEFGMYDTVETPQRQSIVERIAEAEGLPVEAAEAMVPQKFHPATVFYENANATQRAYMERTGQWWLDPLFGDPEDVSSQFKRPGQAIADATRKGIQGDSWEKLVRYSQVLSKTMDVSEVNMRPVARQTAPRTPTPSVGPTPSTRPGVLYAGTRADVEDFTLYDGSRFDRTRRPLGIGTYFYSNHKAAMDDAMASVPENAVGHYPIRQRGRVYEATVKLNNPLDADAKFAGGTKTAILRVIEREFGREVRDAISAATKGSTIGDFFAALNGNLGTAWAEVDEVQAYRLHRTVVEYLTDKGWDGVFKRSAEGEVINVFPDPERANLPISVGNVTEVGDDNLLTQVTADVNAATRDARVFGGDMEKANALRAQIRLGHYLRQQVVENMRKASDRMDRAVDRLIRAEGELEAISEVDAKRLRQQRAEAAQADLERKAAQYTDEIEKGCL